MLNALPRICFNQIKKGNTSLHHTFRFMSITKNSNFKYPDDIRIGETITKNTDKGDVVLVGFPYDEGVRRNNGRIGAAEGPAAFRKLITRIGPIYNMEYNIDCSKLQIGDFGDVEPGLELEDAHAKLTEKVSTILKNGGIPFVIGGGNDQSYPNGLGLLNHVKDASTVGIINIDAHLDVRPKNNGKVHSGSPFRLLLETTSFSGKNFVEFAAQGLQCSKEHSEYVLSNGGTIHWLKDLKKNGVVSTFKQVLESLPDNIFVSFDIDAIQSSDCPGVSAPGTVGLTAQEALDICFEAGKCAKVKLVDCSEYNPKIEDYRTGKLLGNMFYAFVLGLAERKKNQ